MQNTATYKYLNLIPYNSLVNWSASFALSNKVNYKEGLQLIKIGKLIIRNRNKIVVDDEMQYRRVTIKLYGKGVIQRDQVKGNTIGTKNQFVVSQGQFIMSKIDARNGAFGLVPKELEGAIVTQDFLSYNINENVVMPDFFLLLTSTKEFLELCQRASSGTTGRQRVDELAFLNFLIPIPSMVEQRHFVDAYNKKLAQAEIKEKESLNAEEAIETYFLEKLGLSKFTIKNKKKGLTTVDYKTLDRWDFFSTDSRINTGLSESKFELRSLGTIYEFTRRGWNSKTHQKSTFRYIEIGAIDPSIGIQEAKTIESRNAPSRASQIVEEGDLIIATTRPYLKKFALVTKEFDKCICSSGFSVIKKSIKYNLAFLKQFLMCSYGIEQLKNKMTGALYPAITEGELRNIKIPFPSFDEQNKIMELVEKKWLEILTANKQAEDLKRSALKEFEANIFSESK